MKDVIQVRPVEVPPIEFEPVKVLPLPVPPEPVLKATIARILAGDLSKVIRRKKK